MLDFFHDACAPCHVLERWLLALWRRHAGELTIYQVMVDDDPDTPRRYGVMSVPTLHFFRNGREVTRLDGLIGDDDLERALARTAGGLEPGLDADGSRTADDTT